tara:strand:- start:856 stop:1260 length:405 start_codon:yes stop_codon:yes gene_type:complete
MNNKLIEFDFSAKYKKFIKNEGVKIYKENNFFKDLNDLMSNKQFKKFYDKYFTNWMEVEVMLMYMKLYDTMKTSYEEKYKHPIDEPSLLFMIREVIRNNESRRWVLDNFELFKNGKEQIQSNIFKKKKNYLNNK